MLQLTNKLACSDRLNLESFTCMPYYKNGLRPTGSLPLARSHYFDGKSVK